MSDNFNEASAPARSPQEQVRYLLKRLALEVTPEGTLEALADEIGVHRTTLSGWNTEGRVPLFKARHLNKRFGDELCPIEDLCPNI